MLRKKKAFTMVETTIVIAVLATLLGTLVPSFSHVMSNANKTSMARTLSSSYDAIKMIDLKDGTMEYNNGLIFAKSKDSKQIYYAIVSNGNLSVTYTTSDKQRLSSIGNDYFCLPKCPGNYQAKIEENGVLKVYYNQDVENNISDQEEFVRTQAVHIVRGEDNVLDNAGNGGSVFDMAEKKDLDGGIIMSAKFISTGKSAPLKVEFVPGITNPLDFSLEHSWDSGTVTTAATCTTEGNKRYTCTLCSATKDETIPANGSHSPVTDPAVAATCTETGLTEGSHCSACGEVLTAQQTVPATGHSYTTTKAATCTSSGTNTCSNCGEITNISPLGHDYVSSGNYNATCTDSGWSGRTECSRCGSVGSSGSSTPATGHWYDTSIPATCTSSGTLACLVCGATKESPARGHSYSTTKSPTCTSSGTQTCSVCGETASIPAMGHDLVSSGTCIQNCSRCSYSKESHDFQPITGGPFPAVKCTICGSVAQSI